MNLAEIKQSPQWLEGAKKHNLTDLDATQIFSIAMLRNEQTDKENPNDVHRVAVNCRTMLAEKFSFSHEAKQSILSSLTSKNIFVSATKGGLDEREQFIFFMFGVMLPFAKMGNND